MYTAKHKQPHQQKRSITGNPHPASRNDGFSA